MRHEQEVDTELARLWEEAFDLERTLGWKVDALHRANGETRRRDSRWRDLPWETPLEDTLASMRAKAEVASGPYPDDSTDYETVRKPYWAGRRAADALTAYEEAVAAVRANRAAQRPLEDEYDEHRWSRFFLVQNTGGHIHSSMHCKTTFPTTRWGWLPDLSGLTEEDAVKAEGPRLCSICFPSAPVEWTLGLPKAPQCEGSGKRPKPGYERYNSQPCSVCGKAYPVSRNTGVVRAHKPPKEAKNG